MSNMKSNMKSALVGYPSGQDGPIPPDGIAPSGLPAGFDPAQGKEVCVTDLNSPAKLVRTR